MTEINTLTAFLGWCSILNIGVLMFSTLTLMLMKESIINLHSKLFGINQSHLPEMYFQYLANYKIAIIVFNLVPYITLKLLN